MSVSLYKVTEPRLDFNEDPVYTIPESASQILYRQFPATTYSDNTINIQTTLDRKYAVSSKMFMTAEFIVTINGTPTPGGRLVNAGNDAPRFMPLTSITQTLEVSLNNQSFTQKINWYHDALMRYNNDWSELSHDLTTFPSMFDSYQQYDDYLKYGSGLNALAQIGEAGPGVEPRGGFPWTVISGNGIDETQAKIRFRTYEPLVLSPLNWGHNNTKSFRDLNTLTVNYTFQTNLGRVWSRAAASGGTITNISASLVESGYAPVLEVVLMSPKTFQEIPAIQRYPYGEIQVFPNAAATLAPGGSATTSLNNVTLSGIPSRIYVFIRRRDQDRTYATTDTYARINSIDMILGTVNGIFTQASPQQLYAISAQNGYQGSFSDWYRYSGSVFCMDFSKDVPIKDLEAAGLQENIQLQLNVDYSNIQDAIGGDTINYQAYTVVLYDGIVTIADAQVHKERNVLSRMNIADAMSVQALPYSAMDTFSVSGGSFGSRLKKAASTAVNIGKRAAKAYGSLPPGVRDLIKSTGEAGLDMISPRIREVVQDFGPAAMDIVKSLKGQGYTENQIYKKLVKMQGSGMSGGKRLTKAQLNKLAKIR